MHTALWIGIGAAVLVIGAHIVLFWFFVRPGQDDDEEEH